MKGYGNQNFGYSNILSKEEAIALAYVAAGKEGAAQQAGEAIDNAKTRPNKQSSATKVWSDGYLSLASSDGLISAADYADVLADPNTLTSTSFIRTSYAKRQDMAFWICKTLGILPTYGQNKIFNDYNDWKNASPIDVPYIESVLENAIMNGDDVGNFSPTGFLTREQAAQIIKNAENFIFPILKYEKRVGTVENISESKDLSNGTSVITRNVNIRNVNGKLDRIIVTNIQNSPSSSVDELMGQDVPAANKNLIVYKNNNLGFCDQVKIGDNIQYIVTSDNLVKYVNVTSNTDNNVSIGATVKAIDLNNSSIEVSYLFTLLDPNGGLSPENIISDPNTCSDETYKMIPNVPLFLNNSIIDANGITVDMPVVLILKNNIVQSINIIDLNTNNVSQGVFRGIVEDNNPTLQYITLFDENGDSIDQSGNNPNQASYKLIRYIDPEKIQVIKNGKPTNLADIDAGDSVFVKLDNNGNLDSISAVDNYVQRFGKVLAKMPSSIAIKFDDGDEQILGYDNTIPIYLNQKLTDYIVLKNGDRIKMLLQETGKLTRLKEITIGGNENLITNVYKGVIAYFDDKLNQVVIKNQQRLDKDNWSMVDQKGFNSIILGNGCEIFSNDEEIDIGKANKLYRNKEAYLAVEKGYGGEEMAVFVTFRENNDTELPIYDDTIIKSIQGSGEFEINNNSKTIAYGDGTIVIKNGRLVYGSSIVSNDEASIVANRKFADGSFYANVVDISDRSNVMQVEIYRGKISKINEDKNFTLESFSEYKDEAWEFYNTPKSFDITFDTRILNNTGVLGQRDFVGYDPNSFLGQSVYVVADATNALQINTAPYGSLNIKGQIYKVTTDPNDSTQITGFSIRNSEVLDPNSKIWGTSSDTDVTTLKNTIVIKAGKLGSLTDLKVDQNVEILKKDLATSTDAYMVFVE